jgi:hypothetical protein
MLKDGERRNNTFKQDVKIIGIIGRGIQVEYKIL